MITSEQLYAAVKTFRAAPDEHQRRAIEQGPEEALFIVAGPGSGKTTCLALRILKLVLVDDVPPRGIVATTFTKKAAQELRSRVLGWGFSVIDALRRNKGIESAVKKWLDDIDINQVWTGTLDSLCEELLRDYRAPGTQPPVLADEFVSKTLLLRAGLFADHRLDDPDLQGLLLGLHDATGSRFGFHVGAKVGLLQSLWDRQYQDQIDWSAFSSSGTGADATGRKVLTAALEGYQVTLAQKGMVDFALLENEVLQRLRRGQLADFTQDLKVLLVDEYQDTNLLQEQIYFALAKGCSGALAVVGDDDQSLYRFRGATVDLFSEFPARYRDQFRRNPQTIYLSTNYRSTSALVNFVDNFARLDAGYQTVRASGKPRLSPRPKAEEGRPVLGMFRDTREVLAKDLADFIHKVFRGGGFSMRGISSIVVNPDGGDIGDCTLLCSSPAEMSSGNEPRLPRLLKDELGSRKPKIEVFNPRGEDVTAIPIIRIFGGLIAECLDPGGAVQVNVPGLSRDAAAVLDAWRGEAIDYVTNGHGPKGLLRYAEGWVNRDPARRGLVWPRSVAVIELIYGLLHYFPELHDDPEGQIYLEVFTRQLGACEQVGSFKARVLHDPGNKDLSDASVRELLRDFLGPIASDTVTVDEELIEAFPRDRLSVLSIHQSKGLEFPITIVDVGSDFKTNHRANAFKRFPSTGGPPHRMEDLLRRFSPLGASARGQVDRAFDDLIRQYFVAFSRPQDVLLLVGLRPTFPGGRVPNVATGWDRGGVPRWSADKPPFVEI